MPPGQIVWFVQRFGGGGPLPRTDSGRLGGDSAASNFGTGRGTASGHWSGDLGWFSERMGTDIPSYGVAGGEQITKRPSLAHCSD